ncbi:MAG: methyltransferase [Panacagrimonas sp.]
MRSTAALCELGHWLLEQHYSFICPTPETHARVNARPGCGEARDLRAVFGWSRAFRAELLPARALELLRKAGALEEASGPGGLLRSKVRYSSIGEKLFVHSAFPTSARDAVFLGPDTYRFVSFIGQSICGFWPCPVRRLLDIGCGSGAGAILAADFLDPHELPDLVLADINPLALQMTAANIAINRTPRAQCVLSDALSNVDGTFDLIVSNPPYMLDARQRTYCHGGDNWGVDIAVRFLRDAVAHLAPGGRLILYTGTPVINGQDLFQLAVLPILQTAQLRYRYTELDPDVFGEDLDLPGYAAVERIAVVGLVVHR